MKSVIVAPRYIISTLADTQHIDLSDHRPLFFIVQLRLLIIMKLRNKLTPLSIFSDLAQRK